MINSPRFASLLDMLQTFTPMYEICKDLGRALERSSLGMAVSPYEHELKDFRVLVEKLKLVSESFGFRQTAKQANGVLDRYPPDKRGNLLEQLKALDTALHEELEDEGVVRIPYDRIGYFEKPDAFGPEIAAAFPSCQRDIERAGTCYALDQPDACVHHLMLVLERGLNALAGRLGVPFKYSSWEEVIKKINTALGPIPKGDERQTYLEISADFGFLKVAYRNHAEHVRDDHYDMPKALSIYNHTQDFMRHLAKVGITE